MTLSGHSQLAHEAHHLAASRLAARDQRYTGNRRSLVDILLAADGPITIATILAEGDGLAQSSAYRNLVILEEAGVVHRIVTSDDHARYELSETVTGEHHHHLICESCGDILDVTLPSEVEDALNEALIAEADRLGFTGAHHRADLIGRCGTCPN